MEKILILDFGSQTTQLIGRRIREIGVFSEVLAGDIKITDQILEGVKGIILSGSPYSVYEKDSPRPDPRIYKLQIPLMGICYGLQRIMQDNGGLVTGQSKKEYGRARIRIKQRLPLFDSVKDGFISWMSHGDTIQKLANSYKTAALTENGIPAVVVNNKQTVYGLQFHPEVTHCEYGNQILENFSRKICGAKPEWNIETIYQQTIEQIKQKVGTEKVLLLISGGVDSSVVAALLLKSLSPEQVYLMYIDTGLMRQHESEEVCKNLGNLGAKNIYHINAANQFLTALEGVTDPEQKRNIIGDLFIAIQEREIKKLGIEKAFLAQGTLYTDLIESGKGVGAKAHVIKSHHNVRTPLIEKKRKDGRVIEPLSCLYKDEVRKLGKRVGLAENIINRHPFPGPGLAVRILGEVTPEKCDILRQADYIFIEQLKKRGLYNKIWQAFCVLLPLRSVGVSGDVRRYGYVLCLRAVVSFDAMTADVFPFPMDALLEISSMITNSIKEIGRVVYDVSSKPPATIEWE